MKKIFSLLLLFSMSSMLLAQEPLKGNQQAVQQTIIKMFDALSNRDSISLKIYCTADIQLFEYGQIWNIDTLILKAITQNLGADFKRTNTIDFINITISKGTAWATYNNQADIFKNGKQTTVKWLETVVLVKEEKQWKINHLHSTLIKRT